MIATLILSLVSGAFQPERPISKFSRANLAYLEDVCSVRGSAQVDRACVNGETVCCLVSADSWYLGGVCQSTDHQKSRDLLLLACEQGSSSACRQAANVSRWSQFAVTEAERQALEDRASLLAKSNCEAGDPGECIQSALMSAPDQTNERLAHLRRALDLWRASCDKNRAVDCFDLAVSLDGGPLHGDSAAKYYRRACALGLGQACRDAAKSAKSCTDGVAVLQRGCELGSVGSCTDAAGRYSSPPPGCRRDYTAALAALDEACRLGSLSACHQAAAVYLRSKSPTAKAHGENLRGLACGGGLGRELCGLSPEECRAGAAPRLLDWPAPRAIDPKQAEKWRRLGFSPKP